MPIASTLLLALALSTPPRPRSVPSDTVPCLTSGSVQYMRERLVAMMITEDSATAFTRAIWKLPRTNPDRIVVVTDPTVCTRVAATYYADVTGPLRGHGIGVVRVGTHLVAVGDLHAGEWAITTVYDARLHPLASVGR